jgi:polysaccharide pyruvyl transferase WcaK-like protein
MPQTKQNVDQKIKILVTGLCLSRNRGGAAMAISFMDLINRYIPSEFIFAVDPNYMELEKFWGDHYGAKVVPRDTLWIWFMTMLPFRLIRLVKHGIKGRLKHAYEFNKFWEDVHKQIKAAFLSADCIINLNGIAFVGDGTRSVLSSITERTCSIYSKLNKKPFFRFIQSYGPFDDWRVRTLAKNEFKILPCIMARGKIAAAACHHIVNKMPVYSFPDVAITLESASDKWLDNYLAKLKLSKKKYIVLSPSSVIAALPEKSNSSLGAQHITAYAKIAEKLLIANQQILFVPHNTSPHPNQCDREISQKALDIISKRGIDTENCRIVNDELDCRQLKAIIAKAKFAIVSRYHALVAALSTGVPAVTIGWNAKYQDILDFYKSAEFAIDARKGDAKSVAEKALQKADQWSNEQVKKIKDCQKDLEAKVNHAGQICAKWILMSTLKQPENKCLHEENQIRSSL